MLANKGAERFQVSFVEWRGAIPVEASADVVRADVIRQGNDVFFAHG